MFCICRLGTGGDLTVWEWNWSWVGTRLADWVEIDGVWGVLVEFGLIVGKIQLILFGLH
jgi:hypothetical protein